MSGDDGFLHKTYGLDSADKVEQHYDAWAASYEKELTDNGYVTPQRCARALRSFVHDTDLPLLDLGCGTGLSGLALLEVGFTVIDGCDFSEEMLVLAKSKLGVYRNLERVDLSHPLDVEVGRYANACAAGVINPGHAPRAAIGYVLDILPANGRLVFSLNDHAVEEGFHEEVELLVGDGRALLDFEEHGDHIPGIGLKSTVYVLRKPD